MNLGIIGAGNMGTAILNGIISTKVIKPDNIFLSNRSEGKLAPWANLGIHTSTDNAFVAHNSDLILLAISPQMLENVLDSFNGEADGKVLISILAGVTSYYLRNKVPGCNVIRVMPNTPSLLGAGTTAIAKNSQMIDDNLYQMVVEIFESIGTVELIDESLMNEIIPVNGSSPAFFFKMALSMMKAARTYGIDDNTSRKMIADTMIGSAKMILESDKTPQQLMDDVCTPGGATYAGLEAFNKNDFDSMIQEAFDNCINKAYELGK